MQHRLLCIEQNPIDLRVIHVPCADSMLVRLLHPLKVAVPILVTLSPIVMLVRPVHSRKAQSPILVTLSGVVMLVRLGQLSKALFAMLVTPSGIV